MRETLFFFLEIIFLSRFFLFFKTFLHNFFLSFVFVVFKRGSEAACDRGVKFSRGFKVLLS